MSAALDLRSTIPSGELVSGKFRIEGIVGEGGLGYVYEATHLELDERVALKFLKPEMASRPDVVQRFSREARAVVKLKSEHVARVMDVGSHEGRPFIVMELLKGSDLSGVIRGEGAIDVSRIADYLIQACEALAEAHARGIVHRDIKPENLFLVHTADWQTLKVLDFGISKVALTGELSTVSLDNVQTASIVGSPYYLSPEQIRSSRDVDHRTDIWSLGVVAFELAAGGEMPFVSTDFTALVAEIIERPHRSLIVLNPSVPQAFVQIVNRCLEKDPAERFQSAAELAMALLPFAPKRARAAAERALMLARSAGHITADMAMPNSLAPPPMMIEPAAQSAPRILATSDVTSSREVSLSATVPGPDPLRRKSKLPYIAAPIALLALLGGAFVLRGQSNDQVVHTGPPQPVMSTPVANGNGNTTSVGAASSGQTAPVTTVVAANPNTEPLPSAATVTAASAAPTTSASGKANPMTAVKNVPTVPPVRVTPSATPKPPSDLDIRRER